MSRTVLSLPASPNRVRTGAALCAALLFLSSCAGTHKRGGASPSAGGSSAGPAAGRTAVFITDRTAIGLLPPSRMAGSMDALMLFTGSYGTRRVSCQAYILAGSQGVLLTFLNEMGMDMGSLRYGKDGASFNSAYLTGSVRAEYVLADFQNCYYDPEALQENYASCGLRFTAGTEDGREYRRIYDGGTLIEEICKAPGKLSVTNRLRSYRYELVELAQPGEAALPDAGQEAAAQ